MDRGDLVPDDVIVGVIAERIDSEEAADGFILDGFPRTEPQAEALDEKLDELGAALTAVLLIDVSDDEVVRRLGGRRTCEENGHVFHVEFNPPEQEGVCDLDGSELHRSRRRQARGDPPPARAVPREDRAAGRATTTTRACCAGSTAPRRRSRWATRSRARWRRCASKPTRRSSRSRRAASVYRMIIRKTPEQVEKMAASGDDPGPLPADARRQGPRRGHHRGARRRRREVHPLPGRRAGLQGLPRLPGLDLRLAELDGRARHPGPLRAASAATCSRSTSASSRTAGSRTRRSPCRSAPISPEAASSST